MVTKDEVGWLCGTGSLRLRLRDERMIPTYLDRLLRTRALRSYFKLSSVGSTMDNLNSEIVLSMPALLPAPDEQVLIVEQATELQSENEQAGHLLAQQISLLSERRQALVAAAVTGEFAVPGAA